MIKSILINLFLFFAIVAFAKVDSGYIYVIENSTFKKSIYKIGMTRQTDPLTRIKQLYTTSIAKPYTIKLIIASDSVLADERRIHNELAPYRIDRRREFFKKDYRTIKKVVFKNITKSQNK